MIALHDSSCSKNTVSIEALRIEPKSDKQWYYCQGLFLFSTCFRMITHADILMLHCNHQNAENLLFNNNECKWLSDLYDFYISALAAFWNGAKIVEMWSILVQMYVKKQINVTILVQVLVQMVVEMRSILVLVHMFAKKHTLFEGING